MTPVNWDGTEKVMDTQAVTTVTLTNDVIQNLILFEKKSQQYIYIHINVASAGFKPTTT